MRALQTICIKALVVTSEATENLQVVASKSFKLGRRWAALSPFRPANGYWQSWAMIYNVSLQGWLFVKMHEFEHLVMTILLSVCMSVRRPWVPLSS